MNVMVDFEFFGVRSIPIDIEPNKASIAVI